MNVLDLSEQEIQRRNSLDELRKMGINPYPAAEYKVTAYSDDIKANFNEEEKREVCIAGRLMGRRVMGKASFAELMDSKGRIQVYVTRDDVCPGEDKTLYNTVFKKLLDLGDFIGVKGFVFRTQTGEISVHAQELVLLSKSLKPLPVVKEKDGVTYDAFNDPELRYRQRYVDLLVNPGVKDIFMKRTQVIKTMREYFDEAGYTEVETPILQPIPGGASARPFITHHNSLDVDLYLRIATELYLKRLIVGGFEGVYEIGKNFRNEGMDRNHNPEFTCMELYVQYKDYNWMMSFTEKLLERICVAVNGKPESVIDGKTISFKAPFRRLPILEAIKEKTGYDLNGKSEDEIREICKKLNMEIDDTMGKGKLIDEMFGEFCEGTYIQPTFITDYPIEMSPLTKKHRDNPALTERFELMVNGKELANAYSELNDPIDQEERFQDQLRLSEKGDDEAMFIDQDFLRALQYGMPPTSGIGIGIDRLVMLMTGQTQIQEVLFFPQMRPEKMLIKEIFTVDKADKFLYFLAPFLVIAASVGTFSFLPWNKGMHVLDFNVGVFLLTAISSIGVLGIFLAGWGSNNKYSVVSAMRGAVQMISYEMSLCLCLICVVIMTGSMQLSEIVTAQTGPWKWLIIQGHVPAILAFLAFLVAGNAEANRGPFDLAEAESELTAGYHTEYSGMGFGFYYLAEYLNLFVISGIASGLFLGGWAPLNIGIEAFDNLMNLIPGFIWFFGKTFFVVWLLMWVRWTFPRLRVDQILKLEWKYIMPFMLCVLVLTSVCVALGLTF